MEQVQKELVCPKRPEKNLLPNSGLHRHQERYPILTALLRVHLFGRKASRSCPGCLPESVLPNEMKEKEVRNFIIIVLKDRKRYKKLSHKWFLIKFYSRKLDREFVPKFKVDEVWIKELLTGHLGKRSLQERSKVDRDGQSLVFPGSGHKRRIH